MDLTPAVDVLILVFLAFVTRVAFDSRSLTDRHERALLDLVDRMEDLTGGPVSSTAGQAGVQNLEDRVSSAHHLLDRWEALLSSISADLDRERQAVAEQMRRADRAEVALDASVHAVAEHERIRLELANQVDIYRGLTPEAQQAIQDLLTTAITVLELYIAGDRIVAYQRIPNGPRTDFTEPIVLTRIVVDQAVSDPSDYDRVYLGALFERLGLALDNTLAQTGLQDQVYYLMVNEEDNSCTALEGLDGEIYQARDLLVVPPRHACP